MTFLKYRRPLFLLMAAGLFLAAGGCFRRATVRGPGDPDWGVRITWHGHSCFSFEDSVGRLFQIDPFDESIGYKLAWVEPDVVLITHDHFDHSYLRHAAGFELVTSTGVHVVSGIEVTGLPGYHDAEEGKKHGLSRAYVWEMGGLRLAHLGDIGQNVLTPEQREGLQNIDILFIPVGGKTTVDAPAAARLIDEIHPRVVVPMHYGNEQVRFFEFEPVENFLDLYEEVLPLPETSFQMRRANLPEKLTIYIPSLPPAE
ncbi:MAG: MBL fold metallo-hydrolase [Elusimicrobia bacterium]|nr:MBL fold metallo-hydrolase [Elusimicrobiota bacterium]